MSGSVTASSRPKDPKKIGLWILENTDERLMAVSPWHFVGNSLAITA
jgi:hypothetical protein